MRPALPPLIRLWHWTRVLLQSAGSPISLSTGAALSSHSPRSIDLLPSTSKAVPPYNAVPAVDTLGSDRKISHLTHDYGLHAINTSTPSSFLPSLMREFISSARWLETPPSVFNNFIANYDRETVDDMDHADTEILNITHTRVCFRRYTTAP